MAGNRLPENKKPRLNLSKTKRKAASGVEAKEDSSLAMPSSSSIASFFNNVPPAKISCPLCGQIVSRYGINKHIDEVCEKSQRDDVVLVDSGTVPLADVLSPYFAKNASTPEKNPNPPGADDCERKALAGGETSPYFKKGAGRALSDGQPGKVDTVRSISLGSLSTKLSRKRRARGGDGASSLGSKACEKMVDPNPKDSTSMGGSQKENQLPLARFQECPSSKEGPTNQYGALDLVNDFDVSSLPLGDPVCSELGLSTGAKEPPNVPKNGPVLDLQRLQVCPSASSELPTGDASSAEQDPIFKAGKKCHNPVPNVSSLEDDGMEVLPMEGHRNAKNEARGDSGSGALGESPPIKSNFETVLGVPGPDSDAEGHPYYLRNFLMVLQAVLENEDDRRLFDEQDLETVAKFYRLSAGGQKLYVRLFQRKLSWIKTNKIEYAEISQDLSPVIGELVEAGFLQSETELQDLSEVLDLLSAPELKTLAKTFHLRNPNAQKQQILEDFLRLAKQRSFFSSNQAGVGSVILKRAKELAGKCVRICKGPRAVFSRVLLLFSLSDPTEDEEAGSGGQGQLSTVLMVNMGRVAFPTYNVNRKTPIFEDRDDFIRYATAAHLSNDVSVAQANGNWKEGHNLYKAAKVAWEELKDHPSLRHHAALPEYLRRFTVGWVYTRILSRGVEILQRLHMYEEAVEQLQDLLAQEIYCMDSRGRWWDRLALNLHQHLKDTEKAVQCIRKGLLDPFVRTGHRLSLSQRAQKIRESPVCKKFRSVLQDLPLLHVEDVAHVTIKGKLCPQTGMGKSVFIMEDLSMGDQGEDLEPSTFMCSVEELALAHYKQNGFNQGIHGEGSTFSTLYGLLMWDILFMDGIPDVFRNHYQAFPLDLYTDSFYENRQAALESRLELLYNASAETLQDWIGDVWNAQEGKAAALISWERFSSLHQAQSLACCFGGPFLSGVFRRLSKDLRHCRGGLPDLVVWRSEDQQFKLVEVKGPNDRLSHKQMLWLAELQRLGAVVEVCHVVAIGAKSKRLS
ncbi:fanconi-associated nuclease 1 isoform X1 [Sceloporus undulatus]|uniref:fanconi-associated nuclease 1 isoform X1 n=1 Tax=Sceloporus undulatus TaxID=8520 RepID=UPI001C4A8AC2|nr:fanconi-associated nuclease 1 isoform X1 [Sceloporus undulatus]XP_042330801.1 fanconi-associated nuclease 1 isoform X1 [Sceloporus undulatus]